jgi:hypothetical protein
LPIDLSDKRWGGYVPWFFRHADFSGTGNFLLFFERYFKSGVGAKFGRLKKVKDRLKKYLRGISKFANKMAEVHGNRTHLGRF